MTRLAPLRTAIRPRGSVISNPLQEYVFNLAGNDRGRLSPYPRCFDSYLDDMKKLHASLAIAALLPLGLVIAQDQNQPGPVEKTENTTKKVAHKTGEAVTNTAKATGSAVSNGAKATERTVGKGLQKAGTTIRRAGNNSTPIRHHRVTAHTSPTPKESPLSKASPSPEQSATPEPVASPTATP
jgi:hypothetical protein